MRLDSPKDRVDISRPASEAAVYQLAKNQLSMVRDRPPTHSGRRLGQVPSKEGRACQAMNHANPAASITSTHASHTLKPTCQVHCPTQQGGLRRRRRGKPATAPTRTTLPHQACPTLDTQRQETSLHNGKRIACDPITSPMSIIIRDQHHKHAKLRKERVKTVKTKTDARNLAKILRYAAEELKRETSPWSRTKPLSAP